MLWSVQTLVGVNSALWGQKALANFEILIGENRREIVIVDSATRLMAQSINKRLELLTGATTVVPNVERSKRIISLLSEGR